MVASSITNAAAQRCHTLAPSLLKRRDEVTCQNEARGMQGFWTFGWLLPLVNLYATSLPVFGSVSCDAVTVCDRGRESERDSSGRKGFF